VPRDTSSAQCWPPHSQEEWVKGWLHLMLSCLCFVTKKSYLEQENIVHGTRAVVAVIARGRDTGVDGGEVQAEDLVVDVDVCCRGVQHGGVAHRWQHLNASTRGFCRHASGASRVGCACCRCSAFLCAQAMHALSCMMRWWTIETQVQRVANLACTSATWYSTWYRTKCRVAVVHSKLAMLGEIAPIALSSDFFPPKCASPWGHHENCACSPWQ
jgi:hypothetical protein